jgi:hypothetical protein
MPLPGYYTADHIYPVGFCSTRLYLSINAGSVRTGSSSCLYTCKISDGGTAAKFEISPEDLQGMKFSGSDPSQCHRQLLEAINASWGMGKVPMEPRGAEFFGLSHPTVQNLIQSLTGARRCVNYNWLKFESSHDQSDAFVDDDPTVNLALIDPLHRSTVSR